MAGTNRGRGRGRGLGRKNTILRDVSDTTPASSSHPTPVPHTSISTSPPIPVPRTSISISPPIPVPRTSISTSPPTPQSHIPLTTSPLTRVPHNGISTSPPTHTTPLHTQTSDTPAPMQHEPSPDPSIDVPHSPAVASSAINAPTDMASSSNIIGWGKKDADGRIWIRSAPKLQFYPTFVVRGKITAIFKQKFDGAWTCWSEVTGEAKEGWWAEFKALFKWLPEDEDNIKRSFHSRGSDSLKNALNKVRSGQDKGNWIRADKLEELWTKWKTDDWAEKSTRNKLNRQAQEGLNVHSGGSVDGAEHARRLAVSLNRQPTFFELYERLHRPKGKSAEWHNERQQQIAETYQLRVAESEGGEGSSSQQSENSIFLEVVGGKNKKGRIYGLGSQAATVNASSASSSCQQMDAVSPSRVMQMQSTIDDLATQLQHCQQQFKDSEEQRVIEAENMKKKMEEWDKLIQTMMSNQTLNPPPPPPPQADN